MARNGGLSPRHLADLCLGHLAGDPEQLAQFMTISGHSPASLRAAVGTDQLQIGLIDYFAQNEALLLALCGNNSMKPDQFMRIWADLNPAG